MIAKIKHTIQSRPKYLFELATSVSNLGVLHKSTNRLKEAKSEFENTISGQTNVYGLHFMDASISINNLVTIPKAVINENTYYKKIID